MLAAASAVMSSCSTASANGETPAKKEVGLQLYSMRGLMAPGAKYENNLPALLDTLGKMGYTHFEAANYDAGNGTFYGLKPEEFKKAAEDAGVKITSSHTGRTLSPEGYMTAGPQNLLLPLRLPDCYFCYHTMPKPGQLLRERTKEVFS